MMAQLDVDETEGVVIEPRTELFLNNLVTKPNGLLVNTGSTLWYWDGSQYRDLLTGASALSFNSPLQENSGTVTLDMAAFDFTQITVTYPNLDIDSTDDFDGDYGNLSNPPDLSLKQDNLTLTTTGTSGAATLVGSTLNIPQYSGGGGSTVNTTGDQNVDDVKTFVGNLILDYSLGAVNNSTFLGFRKMTNNTNRNAPSGFGEIFFNNDGDVRFANDGGAANFSIDFDALTVTKELEVTDTGIFWDGQNLIGGGGGTPDDNSVTTAKIVNGTIINEDIQANSINANDKLQDASITLAKMATDAIATANILDNAITGDKIQNLSINGANEIQDASITPVKISANGNNGQVLTQVAGIVQFSDAPSGSLTTPQANRIQNSRKFKDFLKTANGNITSEDIEPTVSGDEGLKSIISNLDQTIVLDLDDTDIAVGSTAIVQNDGPTADTTVRFADGQTGQLTGSAGSGNQIQLSGFGQFMIFHKRSGFYRVTGNGTISTPVGAIYQGSNALDPVDNQNNSTGVDVSNGNFTVAVITDPDDGAKSALELTRVLANGTAATATIELTGTQTATSYTVQVDAQETAGNVFNVELQDSEGWTTDENLSVSGTMTTIVFQPQLTTGSVGNINLRVRSLGSGNPGDKIVLRNIVITE